MIYCHIYTIFSPKVTQLIAENQHPDSIWTWQMSARGQRQSIWLPYVKSINPIAKSKEWQIQFNGGEVALDLSTIDTIMVYGDCGDLPVLFLDALNQHQILLSIHRRNQGRPYLFVPANAGNADDVLSDQIMARTNLSTSAYVARTLIRERLHSQAELIEMPQGVFKLLSVCRTVDQARGIEANQAARYWHSFYEKLGVPEPIARRNCPNPVNSALDAGSAFMQGVILRWVIHHRLSPFHGFLHRPTTYTGLVFDLMEPYRIWIEQAVMHAVSEHGTESEKVLIPATLNKLKLLLEEYVYVPATRQEVRRKAMLHGVVLALRAYLIGLQTRLVLPVEGERKGGRPPNVGYRLPGYNQ
jgi:CRISPR-associated endonuclease Cas1